MLWRLISFKTGAPKNHARERDTSAKNSIHNPKKYRREGVFLLCVYKCGPTNTAL